MNKAFSLFKTLLINQFSFSTKNKKSTGIYLYLGIFILLSIILNASYYNSSLDIDLISMYPTSMMVFACFFTLISSLVASMSLLFSKKDYNLLTPLPIKDNTIILVKFLVLFTQELIINAIIFVPTIAFYSIVDPTFILTGLISLIFFPTIYCLVSIIVSFIISILLTYIPFFRKISNVIYIFFYLAVILGFSLYSSFINENTANMLTMIPFIDFFIKGAIEHHYLYLLFVSLGVILVTIVISLLYKFFYHKFFTTLTNDSQNRKLNRKDLTTSSPLNTLIKKDVAYLFNNPILFLNSSAGGFISIVMSIIFAAVVRSFSAEEYDSLVILNCFAIGGILIVSLLANLNNYCQMSITLENKTLWLIKSLPIKKNMYFTSKILTNELLIGVPLFISSLIYFLILPVKLYNLGIIISIFILPQLITLSVGILSLLFSLKYYKLDWTSVNEIKNSFFMIPSLLTNFIVGVVITFIDIMVTIYTNIYIGLLISGLFTLISIILFLLLLSKYGKKWFSELQA